MAQAAPARPALVDLPLNTFGAFSTMNVMRKNPTSHKRQIHEVEDAEIGQPASRVCTSPARSASTLKARSPQDDTRPVIPTPNIDSTVWLDESEEGDSQISYKDSMSSRLDFDPDETIASQQTAATELTQPSPSMISRHAETLRLRLRLAHFKVQTNQTNVPLSQLRTSRDESEDPPLSTDSSFGPDDQPSLPKLLPAPVLRPAAYSARTIAPTQIPSSPPSSVNNSPYKATRDDVFRTPALPRHATHALPQQTSSPPDSQERSRGRDDVSGLTSSAVRGKAAIGLLGLRGTLMKDSETGS